MQAIIIAILMMLALPVANLRTFDDRPTCCCPDPAVCKCPAHHGLHTTQPVMKSCHKSAPRIVVPPLPSYAATDLALLVPPVSREALVIATISTPHEPPAPRRPDAPS